MDRTQKRELVATMKDVFSETALVVVTEYKGLSVAEITDLRRKMKAAGAQFQVTKNRLIKLALADTPCAGISDLFTGPTAIAYSPDPVTAAKVTVEFAKQNEKLIVLGGTMGETVLDADGVKALAALPSLDELRGKMVGMLQTPATRIAGVLQAPAGQLARVMNAYATKADAA
ncbi:MAG TPA: 50S ribosomal protein L10 [Alphaproteobacteria bacterium]|nr:50S ribosomal protein L10 [Alphaproteobacteria bacterium]